MTRGEVLIIDDDKGMRTLLIRGLLDLGWTVHATPKVEGFEVYEADVILSEWLPGVSTLLAESTKPVVIHSGDMRAGHEHLVRKPATFGELDAALLRAMGAKQESAYGDDEHGDYLLDRRRDEGF